MRLQIEGGWVVKLGIITKSHAVFADEVQGAQTLELG